MESLRVSAGLAQLSDLKVNLQLEGKALGFFNSDAYEQKKEALDYLHLLLDAQGSLHLEKNTSECPVEYGPFLTSSQKEELLFLEIG